jgi:hypothetical protein
MLQLQICFSEGYWYVRPCCLEVLAFARMIDCLKVILSLPLRLMHWLIGSPKYCVYYVHHWASGIIHFGDPSAISGV